MGCQCPRAHALGKAGRLRACKGERMVASTLSVAQLVEHVTVDVCDHRPLCFVVLVVVSWIVPTPIKYRNCSFRIVGYDRLVVPGTASSGRTKVSMVLVDGLEPPRPDPAACCDQSSYGDQFTTEDLPCERGEATGCETSSPQSHLREEARVTAVHATPRRHHHLYS